MPIFGVFAHKNDGHLAIHVCTNGLAFQFGYVYVHFCFIAWEIPLYKFGMSFESVFLKLDISYKGDGLSIAPLLNTLSGVLESIQNLNL